jgi:hypothetical protein
VISLVTPSGSRDRYAFVALARNFLFVRSGVVFNRIGRFYEVDSADQRRRQLPLPHVAALARGAVGSIKPGVERSETPGQSVEKYLESAKRPTVRTFASS